MFTLGVAATLAVFGAAHATTRFMGWAGMALFLFVRRQQSLFWMHLAIPVFLGAVAFILRGEESFFERGLAADRGSWLHLMHCIGDAGMFLTMVTLPFSFFQVDG